MKLTWRQGINKIIEEKSAKINNIKSFIMISKELHKQNIRFSSSIQNGCIKIELF